MHLQLANVLQHTLHKTPHRLSCQTLQNPVIKKYCSTHEDANVCTKTTRSISLPTNGYQGLAKALPIKGLAYMFLVAVHEFMCLVHCLHPLAQQTFSSDTMLFWLLFFSAAYRSSISHWLSHLANNIGLATLAQTEACAGLRICHRA